MSVILQGQGGFEFARCIGRWAEATPSSLAVDSHVEPLTYVALHAICSRLALAMRLLVPADARIGLLFDRPADYVVAMVAAFMAGRCFVPVDGRYETGRQLMEIDVWLGRRSSSLYGSRLGDWRSIDELQLPEIPEATADVPPETNPAYILFTSGSTGKAKGVEILRRNVNAFIPAICERLGLSHTDRWMQFASPSFDVFIEETLPILSMGGTLYCPESLATPSFGQLHERLAACGATVVELPTRYWCDYAGWLKTHRLAPPPALRLILVGGEQMSAALYREWQAAYPQARLAHVYGVTEATVTSTIFDGIVGKDAEFVPVGTPIASAQVRIEGEQPGEIVIGGPAVGAGYLNEPATTARKFVHDRLSGSLIYHTGDLGFMSGGELVVVGRIDDEVKIDGHRVNLSEIEQEVRWTCGGPDVVIARTKMGRLAAFVELAPQRPQNAWERLSECARSDIESRLTLPSWARPTDWLAVRELPRNGHGKVDKPMLLEWLQFSASEATSCVQPVLTDIELAVLAAFREALEMPEFGFGDDFFEHGGDSLAAVRLVSALDGLLPTGCGAESLVDAPTPEAMTQMCAGSDDRQRGSRQLVLQITQGEADLLESFSKQLAGQFRTSDDPGFVPAIRAALGQMPGRICGEVVRMAKLDIDPFIIVRGHRIDHGRIGETPGRLRERGVPCRALAEEVLIVAYGELIGSGFSWATQQDGRLVHDIFPVKKDEFAQVGTGSQELLMWHTEDAFHSGRGDFILMFALRNPQDVATTVGILDNRFEHELWYEVLFQERFMILPDESHLPENNSADVVLAASDAFKEILRMRNNPTRIAILSGDRKAPKLRLDPYFMEPVPGDTEAADAFSAIVSALDELLQPISLQPGDMLILNNARAVHGRLPFKGRFDGTDRWLKRLNVRRVDTPGPSNASFAERPA